MKGSLVRDEIMPYLRKNLTKERLGHTMAVALLAQRLAHRHGLNPERARLAALLHDSAKCRKGRYAKGKELVKYARKYKVKAPDMEETCRERPKLLHAYVGAHLAKRRFGVRDKQVLSAISKHTLGSEAMSDFDKCVFMADLVSYDRKFGGVRRLRNLAMKDLDRAFIEGLRIKLCSTVRDGQWVHPESVRVWNKWGTDE